MTGSLVDRYVAETLRRLPEKQRPEIERELRAAIADDVDARVELGATPPDAEFAALESLGDPFRLAAGYADRPLTLVGAELYPAYVRTLTVVSWAVLPCVVLVGVVISVARGTGVWGSIFGPLGLAVQVAVYQSFAITLLFVLIERVSGGTSAQTRAALRWTPDRLPPETRVTEAAGWGDFLTTIVGGMVLVALLVIDRFAPIVTGPGGARVPVLDPRLWSGWIPLFLGLLVLAAVLAFVRFRVGRRTLGIAIAGTVLDLATAAALIAMVLTTTVVDPALTDAAVIRPGSWVWLTASAVIALAFLANTARDWRAGRAANAG